MYTVRLNTHRNKNDICFIYAKANYSEILVWRLIVRYTVVVVPIVLYVNRVLFFLQLETTIIDYQLFRVTGKLEESRKNCVTLDRFPAIS